MSAIPAADALTHGSSIGYFNRFLPALSRVYVIVMFIIHPFYMGPQGYANITIGKLQFFAYTTGIFIALTLFSCLFHLVYAMRHNTGSIKSSSVFKLIKPHEYAAALLLLIMLLSALISGRVESALKGSTERSEGWFIWAGWIAVFIILGRTYRPNSNDLLLYCAASSVVSIYGWCQYFGYDFLHLFLKGYEYEVGPQMTFFSTMSNIDFVSTYSCIALVTGVIMFTWGSVRKLKNWFFLLSAVIAFFTLILLRVMSGFVGLAAGFIIAVPFIVTDRFKAAKLLLYIALCAPLIWLNVYLIDHFESWKDWGEYAIAAYGPNFRAAAEMLRPFAVPLCFAGIAALVVSALLAFLPKRSRHIPQGDSQRRRIYRLIWYIVIAAILITGILAVPKLAEHTDNETIQELAELFRGNISDSFGSYRGYVWKIALRMYIDQIKHLRLFGYGPDGFFDIFVRDYYNESVGLVGGVYDKVHNEFLQVLVDSGTFALIAEIVLFAMLLYSVRKKLRDKLTVLCWTAVIVYLVQALFNIATPFAHPLVWIFIGMLNRHSQIEHEQGGASDNALSRRGGYDTLKRMLDFALAVIMTVILSPVLLVCALSVKRSSHGPVFFRQKRVGRSDTNDILYFTMLKFRTMKSGAPSDVPTHLLKNAGKYITKTGAFLRRTSLDELPQLFNIIAGDMSFIGPRPALWNQDDLIKMRGEANSLRPGLTGLAQINGRDEIPVEEKASYDRTYAERYGMLTDMKIFFKTFGQFKTGR